MSGITTDQLHRELLAQQREQEESEKKVEEMWRRACGLSSLRKHRSALRQLMEAEKLCREKLQVTGELYHRIWHEVGRVFTAGGWHEAALKVRKTHYEMLTTEMFEEQNDFNLRAMRALADAYVRLGQFTQARPLREKFYQLMTVKFGAEDEDVLRARRELRELCLAMGDQKRADELGGEA